MYLLIFRIKHPVSFSVFSNVLKELMERFPKHVESASSVFFNVVMFQDNLISVILFISGLWITAPQNISVVDERCKIDCSCCVNSICKPSSDQCTNGCKTGYHGGKCWNKCPERCITCKDNTYNLSSVAECLTCKDGYYSTTELYQCQTKCRDGCKTCQSDTNCTSCNDRYYLSARLCYPCPGGCKNCASETECNSCDSGYYLHSSPGICYPCPKECKSCSSSKKCHNCVTGYYGATCKDNCSTGCIKNECAQNDGVCSCKVGFNGTKCDECATGRYGQDCSRNCSENCLNDICERESGQCYQCDEPFVGAFCENCPNGKYGLHCNISCSVTCLQLLCNRSTGFCDSCINHYEGYFCENCQAGKYGEHCNLKCPLNCHDGYCNRSNGNCFNCSQNTFGLKCQNCIDTFYGPKCTKQCSSRCLNLSCEQETGMCKNGCEDEFSGDMCCLNNSYCVKCSSATTCSICTTRMFGERCEDTCTDICSDQTCDKKTGVCLKGIIAQNVNTAAVLTSVILVVVVFTVIGAVILLRKRIVEEYIKRTRNHEASPTVQFTMLPPDGDRNGNHTNDYENRESRPISYVVPDAKHRVKVNKLAAYVSLKTKDFYTKEFKELPDGLIKPCTDAKKPENVAKNRYQSIYPYDEHRVKLAGPGSDFINACYIDGFNRKKEYIASLGPIMKATENFHLFWRMLWQEKVEKIVMVTNLVENGTMKCEQYWPTIGTTDCYGDISVTCHSEDVYSDYTRRTFTVAKGKVQRSLVHLHFTAWPDKGVPDDVTSLIEFRQKVIATKVKLGGPTIVHCSAGVGRTGTFIALDRLTKEGEKTHSVDVFQCVYNMRQQRTKMLQTEDQYEYLHHAIVHSLTFACDAIPAEKFKKYVASCSVKVMQSKFEQLNNNKEKLSENETKAVINNRQREELNRPGADIPGNCYRIWLYEGRTSEESDYINAVYINGYKRKNRYIIAMTPLPRTVADFITMVIQERISCIVSLDVSNSVDETVGRYMPTDNKTLKIGPFEISSAKVASNKCYTLKKLTVCWKDKAIVRKVSHYQCRYWSDDMKVPTDISQFLQLIRDVEKKADTDPDKGPILVHCLNGAERSGLFCAVSILLQKMEIEHEVSVVNTLRQMKVRRALAIPNKEQYVFCHECVCSYLDTFEVNVYSNFALQGK